MKKLGFVLFLLVFTVMAYGQNTQLAEQAISYIKSQSEKWSLSASDVSEMIISDMYQTKHNGVTHVYLTQSYQGVPVENAIHSIHIAPDGKIMSSASRFIPSLRSKIASSSTKITPVEAVHAAVAFLAIPNAILPEASSRTVQNEITLEPTNFSRSRIPIKLRYIDNGQGIYLLCWQMTFDEIRSSDYWDIAVDASTGKVVRNHNLTISCQHGKKPVIIPFKEQARCQHTDHYAQSVPNSYRVLPLPIESPNHGSFELVIDPADPTASPFGWHDVDGHAGADYTITKGNNVHAYLDDDNTNASSGNEPDGGANLEFDFPFMPNLEPGDYSDIATTNLFFTCNRFHDLCYEFGFDEVAGNFQTNNYGKGGAEEDHVNAEAQDGSGTNNANFSTPADGGSGRMQMYLWSRAGTEVSVTAPDRSKGFIKIQRAAFGPAPDDTPIEGEAILMNDHTGQTRTQGCRGTINGSDYEDKIVLIDRGGCEFGFKAKRVQDEGAVAVIICNFEDALISMGPGVQGGAVTIPTYMCEKSTCDTLKALISEGLRIKVQKPQISGPAFLDGDLDNGIITHEFGHGVSNRLTGGPSSSNCLGNAEQMGEGWSDYFTLITTVEPGDAGTDIRGIGTFAMNQDVLDVGIRRQPYSTDRSISTFNYKDLGSGVHDLGEVWNAVLWDLYWAMADKYGFDPDYANKNSGNAQAVQLVFDAMKIQPCRPGMIDGRDAILMADSLNNNGANSCLIWSVFAARGMGFEASQGSSFVVGDEIESFESHPLCQNSLKISKSLPDVAKAGEIITVHLDVRNYTAGTVTQVRVEDEIPNNTSYIPGSANPSASVSGGKIFFDIGQMNSLETMDLSYDVKVDDDYYSRTIFLDDIENGEDNWDLDAYKGNQIWNIEPDFGVDQSHAWVVGESDSEENDQLIWTINPVKLQGEIPVLVFQHYYDTEAGHDGGLVEISTNGQDWTMIRSFVVNDYDGNIPYSVFVQPDLNRGFSGSTDGEYITSVADLSQYRDEDVQLRFRFGSDDVGAEENPHILAGWIVDNVELARGYFVNGEACIEASGQNTVCASGFGKGVFIEANHTTKTTDAPQGISVSTHPNPTSDQLHIKWSSSTDVERLSLVNAMGQTVKFLDNPKHNHILMNVGSLPRGSYTVELITGDGIVSRVVIIQ